MATVTGITAARAAAIEAASVVSGQVVSGNLILTRQNGSTINAGSVIGPPGATGSTGATGAAGVAGAAGSKLTSGSGAPTSGFGAVTDWYLNTVNGDMYEKTGASTWTLRDNLTGPAGTGGGGGSGEYVPLDSFPITLGVALSDESSTISTGIKARIRAPWPFTLFEVRTNLSIADTATLTTVDIHDASDVSILGTKITIDSNEKTSETAAAPATIVSPIVSDDSELIIYVDGIGTVARGLKLWLLGTRALPASITSVPDMMQPPTAVANSAQVTLTWTAPITGGSPITDYQIEYQAPTLGTGWIVWSDGVSTTLGTTVTGLDNGREYYFRVRAQNANGYGAFSNLTISTPNAPATVPGIPTSLNGTPGATTNVLTWTAPSNGGSAITDYLVQYKAASSGTWLTFSDGVVSSTGAIVTGLAISTSYDFRVAAINAVGTGTVSSTYTATTLTGSVITFTGSTGGRTTLDINSFDFTMPIWSKVRELTDGVSVNIALTTNVGAGIKSIDSTLITGAYEAYASQSYFDFDTSTIPDGNTVTAVTLQLDFTTCIINNTDTLDVYAYDYGTTVTTTDHRTGTQLAALTLVASIPSSSLGTTGVKSFTIESAMLSAINKTGSTRFLMAWRTLRTSVSTPAYDWNNVVSTNKANAVLNVTSSSGATTVPDAPTSLTGTPASTSNVLTWIAPFNGNATITDYRVEYKTTSSGTWLVFSDGTNASTGATVTGLTPSTSYDFRVSALNSVGYSVVSTTYTDSTTAAPTVPGTPTSLAGTPGSTSNLLTWTAPSNGGSAITDYLVEYKTAASGTWLTFADGTNGATGANVTGLTASTSYNFRVSAINAVGTSSVSATYTASTTSAGAAPSLRGFAYRELSTELAPGSSITIEAGSSSQGTGGFTTRPQGGDFLVMVVHRVNDSKSLGGFINVPSGWTEFGSETTGSVYSARTFYKIAGGSSGSNTTDTTYTIQSNAGGAGMVIYAEVYAIANGSSINLTGGNNQTNTLTPAFTGVSPSVANTLLISSVFGYSTVMTNMTPSNGTRARLSLNWAGSGQQGPGYCLAFATEALASSGATGTRTWTFAVASGSVAQSNIHYVAVA